MIYVHSEEMKYADTVQCIACLKLRSILVVFLRKWLFNLMQKFLQDNNETSVRRKSSKVVFIVLSSNTEG
jgi:hypothetical protein